MAASTAKTTGKAINLLPTTAYAGLLTKDYVLPTPYYLLCIPYFGIDDAGAPDAGAGAGAAGAAAAGAVVDGMAAAPPAGAAGAAGAGAGATTLSITPPLTPVLLCVCRNDRPSVALKNSTAATAVDLDMKFDEPDAPNRLPEAPEPKAAPMSAPLPCCISTRPMMARADKTCTTTIRLNKVFMLFHSQIK